MQPILSFCTLLFLSASFASRAWCQLVQDSWTAPASPDSWTSLQSGNPFSIVWKPSLHGQFQGYCHSCDIQRLDLWITSWNNANYNYKFAGKFTNPGFKVTATDLHFRECQHTCCRTCCRESLGVSLHTIRLEASFRRADLISRCKHNFFRRDFH